MRLDHITETTDRVGQKLCYYYRLFYRIIALCAEEHAIRVMSGDNRELEPPDPIPNSEVKRLSADGSVGSPHVRVGHRQAFI